MIYHHTAFQIDTRARTVSDENGKVLAFSDKLFVALAFLAEHGRATTDELGDAVNGGESDRIYSHNSIRQYPYQINKLVGHRIIRYERKQQRLVLIGAALAETDTAPTEGAVTRESLALDPATAPETENAFEADARRYREARAKRAAQRAIRRRYLLRVGVPALFVIALAGASFAFHRPTAEPPAPVSVVDERAKLASLDLAPKPIRDMVTIPAGEFLMGSTEAEALDAYVKNDGHYDQMNYFTEYPQHTVILPAYAIDRKEVSVAEYRMFTTATGRSTPAMLSDQNLAGPNQPVIGVDWDDARAYCQWLGQRLPTEAEWEKAARGTDRRIYPWGDDWDPAKDNHGNGSDLGLDESDGYRYTAPVGTELGISPYGVLNMAGNVYEWTTDDLAPYAGNDKYTYPDYNKEYKVLKGGAYTDGQSEQRPASRVGYARDFREEDFGFRCAADVR